MNSIDAISILESCIEKTINMTQEEFNKIKIERGIDDKKYLERSYLQGNIKLVLPGTSEYNKIFEEESFSNSINIEYNESFQSIFKFESENNILDFNMANAA